MQSLTQQKWVIIATLSVIVLAGTAIRLSGLTERTINHIEMYVAGNSLPYDLALPPPRLTFKEILRGILFEKEPHPPAYYVFMLGWTKIFGTGILALRLPSVLFGVASILLIYVIGVLEKNHVTALVAAGMLALNGHHVLWSQIAKMYSMACFLSLFSTVLLLLAYTSRRWQRFLQLLYLGATLVGLATTIWFWFLLTIHLLWVLVNEWARRSLPPLFKWQFAALILGSPLISLAIYVSSRPSYSEHSALVDIIHFLQFGFLFEPDPFSTQLNVVPVVATVLIIPVALVMLRFGLVSSKQLKLQDTVEAKPFWVIIAICAVLAFYAIDHLTRFANNFDVGQARLVSISGVIPVILFIVYLLLHWFWNPMKRLVDFLRVRIPLALFPVVGAIGVIVLGMLADRLGIGRQTGLGDRQMGLIRSGLLLLGMSILLFIVVRLRFRLPKPLSSWLVILSVIMLIVIYPMFNLLTSRGMLVFTPYLLIVLSTGLFSLIQRSRYLAVSLMILVLIHFLSVVYYRNSYHVHTDDYKSLAEQWIPKIHEDDLIFTAPTYPVTPIFYYLKRDRYNFITANYVDEITKHPASRVWVFSGNLFYAPDGSYDALVGFELSESIVARWLRADLYVPKCLGK